MTLTRTALCAAPACLFCRSCFPDGRRGASLFLVSAGSLVCAGGGGADRVLRRVLDGDGDLSPAGCRAAVARGRLKFPDAPSVENGQVQSSVEIPVTCYQLIGVSEKAEKDEVVKAVMDLKGSEIEDGYTMDVILSRQDLLMDARDKLLFEPEFAGNIKEKVSPRASLRISWAWLPAALCLLQEVGEDKMVLDIGKIALQHQEAKPYAHDLLLSMALAECSIAKISFEKNKISQGFEALARAQYLLRSRTSLEKMPLLSEIEESLEELAPACTLELLSMPQTPENGERRCKAIGALQELLKQGLEVEAFCRVKDWPSFLSHALNRLIAAEIVDLLPWDALATVRKNKKSLESQNQRIIIDFNCFYISLLAHIAVGFSLRQRDLINKARTICESLIASEGIGLKFEDAFCSLLLGQGLEKAALEKLLQLQTNRIPALPSVESTDSNKEASGKKDMSQSVEMWLKDSVLGVFTDTKHCSPSLANYFGGQKRPISTINHYKATAKSNVDVGRISFPSVSVENRSLEDTNQHVNLRRHLGEAVKQLAPGITENRFMLEKVNSDANKLPAQPNKTAEICQKGIWRIWWDQANKSGSLTFMAILGCLLFSTLKLHNARLGQRRIPARLNRTSVAGSINTYSQVTTSCEDPTTAANRDNIVQRLVKMFMLSKEQLKHATNSGYLENTWSADRHSSLSMASAVVADVSHKRNMPIREAEALLQKWQAVKGEALGPAHEVEILSDILAEKMLSKWKALANSAKEKSCFWRFVLLQLSILRAEIISDVDGGETAEIEAVLEEAAELVDADQPKNPNYYSTYKVFYMLKKGHDGSWRFCDGGVQQDSS